LTQRSAFLAPLTEAEAKMDQALEDSKRALRAASGSADMLTHI
jgi:hypothetical protein